MFIARVKRMTEIVQPVKMPISSLHQSAVISPVDSQVEHAVIVHEDSSDTLRSMVPLQSVFDSFVGN